MRFMGSATCDVTDVTGWHHACARRSEDVLALLAIAASLTWCAVGRSASGGKGTGGTGNAYVWLWTRPQVLGRQRSAPTVARVELQSRRSHMMRVWLPF